MTDKVVSIDGSEVPETRVVRESVVETLEEMLERAKSGDIQGIACSFVDSDRCCQYVVAGVVGGYGMIGSTSVMKQDLIDINNA